MQTAIPCLLMRGGTSKGPFFRADDLPQDLPTRDKVLLAALGSPDKRQIDGIGGAHPLTSKVGMVSVSQREGVDLEFLFAQLQPEKDTVDTTPNCGNMLAAVVPFALETGMVKARGETSTFRVLTLNTDMAADITVQTPGGQVSYEGTARIDGAPGQSAPVDISFLDTAGSVCSSEGSGSLATSVADPSRALDARRDGREARGGPAPRLQAVLRSPARRDAPRRRSSRIDAGTRR